VRSLTEAFKKRYTPLQQLLWIGFFLRMFSVIFSKGFGWHDDHFLIIEAAQSWVDGYDYNDWLPTPEDPGRQPSGHSLFYTGLHYFILKFLTAIGLTNPQGKMYVIRLLHALWSLLIIKYGYKIAEQQGGKRVAWYVGMFLALYWFMPFISVRNLVEFVCVPLVLMGIYELEKPAPRTKAYVLAALCLGIAFSVRFQTLFLTGGIGLALIIRRVKFKHIVIFGAVYLLTICLTQGVIDMVIWKRPFAEFGGYVDYNLHNSDQYGYNNWHMYFDLIFGLLIPPLSILLFAGYLYTWRKTSLIFWPVFIYLAFHIYFPNKQERFVMTVLPLIIISGTTGMMLLYKKYGGLFSPKFIKGCRTFVIVINLLLLPVLTVSYSKRHRVEAMSYLRNKTNAENFIMEDSNNEDFLMPPLYYFGKWIKMKGITKNTTAPELIDYYNQHPQQPKPSYIIFWEATNLDARVDSVKKYFPHLQYEATIEPSFIDKTLYWLNPVNSNQTATIYKL
jgi:hypothetical protein